MTKTSKAVLLLLGAVSCADTITPNFKSAVQAAASGLDLTNQGGKLAMGVLNPVY